jgi:hypothetical protein
MDLSALVESRMRLCRMTYISWRKASACLMRCTDCIRYNELNTADEIMVSEWSEGSATSISEL